MQTAWIVVIGIAVFAAVGGLFLAGPRRTPVAQLRQRKGAQMLLRALAIGVLGLCQWGLAILLGWEIAIPTALGLLGGLATANLYLAAVSPRVHLLTSALGSLLTLVATGGLLVFEYLG